MKLRSIELNTITSVIDQGREKTGIIRDPRSRRAGGWKSTEQHEKQRGRRASLGDGQGLGKRTLSKVKKLVCERILHIATWSL